jgi:hypothetical protein
VDEGDYGGVPLAGLKALVVYDCPQHMIEGNWTAGIIIDDQASPGQRTALDTILRGEAGGSWALLAKFVSRRLDTRYLPITITSDGPLRGAAIPGLLDASITDIKGRDRSTPVTFENIFNQIHASTQVLALGSTRYDDGVITIATDKTHGLHSKFAWAVA